MQRGKASGPQPWQLALKAGGVLLVLLLVAALALPSTKHGGRYGLIRSKHPPGFNVSIPTAALTAVLRQAGVPQRLTSSDDIIYAQLPEVYRPRRHSVPGGWVGGVLVYCRLEPPV